jgi:hypothetical protein
MNQQEPPLSPAVAFATTVTWRQWRPLALVLTIAVAGVLLVFVNFRLGALTLAASVAVTAVIRATRTEEDAGLLAVRARYIDLTFLVITASALAVLGLWVPLI